MFFQNFLLPFSSVSSLILTSNAVAPQFELTSAGSVNFLASTLALLEQRTRLLSVIPRTGIQAQVSVSTVILVRLQMQIVLLFAFAWCTNHG